MRAPKPLTDWQATLPDLLPIHIRRNIVLGPVQQWRPELGPCWEWARSCSDDGYGWASLDGKTYQAHRLVYVLLRGDPGELMLDHLCRVRHCVNPDHLDPVTHLVNQLRSPVTTLGRKLCKFGHPLVDFGDQRRCPICRAQYLAAYREQRAA
jgi:HNH endonuclease